MTEQEPLPNVSYTEKTYQVHQNMVTGLYAWFDSEGKKQSPWFKTIDEVVGYRTCGKQENS